MSWSVSGKRDLRLAAGDIFLCYLYWPIRRPFEGVLLCAFVFVKTFVTSASAK